MSDRDPNELVPVELCDGSVMQRRANAPILGTAERCPVCNGAGIVSRPPHIAGDQPTWTTGDTAPYPCRACSGTGIVRAASAVVETPAEAATPSTVPVAIRQAEAVLDRYRCGSTVTDSLAALTIKALVQHCETRDAELSRLRAEIDARSEPKAWPELLCEKCQSYDDDPATAESRDLCCERCGVVLATYLNLKPLPIRGLILRENCTMDETSSSRASDRTRAEHGSRWTGADQMHLDHLAECEDPMWMGEVASRASAHIAELVMGAARLGALRKHFETNAGATFTVWANEMIEMDALVDAENEDSGDDACVPMMFDSLDDLLDELAAQQAIEDAEPAAPIREAGDTTETTA